MFFSSVCVRTATQLKTKNILTAYSTPDVDDYYIYYMRGQCSTSCVVVYTF